MTVFAVTLVLAMAALVCAVTPATAREDDVLDPDRPDVTNSAKTVGAGRVQIETGVLTERERRAPRGEDRDRRDARRIAVETTVRVGVIDSLELRLEGEPYVRLRGPEEDSGHGDVILSAKWRFLDPPDDTAWPALALRPFVKLPVTEAPIGSGKTDFGVVVAASFDLPWRLGLDLNAGVAALGQPRGGGHLLQALASASVSRDVVERVALFGEVFYGSREERDGGDQVGVNAGAVWKVARFLALDVAAGTTVHGRGPDWIVRAGASVRFGR